LNQSFTTPVSTWIVHHHRNVYVGASENSEIVEILRSDADHRIICSSDEHRPSHNILILTELCFPKCGAQNHHRFRAGSFVFVRQECPAGLWLHSYEIEEFSGDEAQTKRGVSLPEPSTAHPQNNH